MRRGPVGAAIADAEALCALPEDAIPLGDRVVHQCLLAHLHARKGDTAQSTRVLRRVIAAHGREHTRYAQLQLQRMLVGAVETGLLQ